MVPNHHASSITDRNLSPMMTSQGSIQHLLLSWPFKVGHGHFFFIGGYFSLNTLSGALIKVRNSKALYYIFTTDNKWEHVVFLTLHIYHHAIISYSSQQSKRCLTYSPLPVSGVFKLLSQHQEVDHIRHIMVSTRKKTDQREALLFGIWSTCRKTHAIFNQLLFTMTEFVCLLHRKGSSSESPSVRIQEGKFQAAQRWSTNLILDANYLHQFLFLNVTSDRIHEEPHGWKTLLYMNIHLKDEK